MELKVEYDSGRKCGILKGDIDEIREHFSVADKGARIQQRFNRFIPTRKYAITPAGRFEVGLLAEIYKFCNTLKKPPSFVISDAFREQFRPQYSLLNTQLIALRLDLRDYQEQCVRKCLKLGRGTVLLGTGGGKTLLTGSLIQNIRNLESSVHFTLIIVPTTQLVEQTYKDLLDYGIPAEDMTQMSGKHDFELGKPITIALAQYLVVSKNVPSSLFEADLVIVDEVHGLKKNNQLDKFVKRFDTPHKFGLTGSLPEHQIDIWNVLGKMGPLIYEKESHSLRQEGYLADVEAVILKLHYDTQPNYTIPSLANPLVAYEEEQEFIINNAFRNNTISSLASKVEQNTLIVVDRIAHGEILEKTVRQVATSKEVYFIRGSVEVEDREKIRDLMEKSNNIIVIAIAKIFATGINIKNLHYIILAVSGKAKVRLIQSIGRGLRVHENKDKLYLFDIADQLKYGTEHQEKRIQIYKQEKIKYSCRDVFEEKKEGQAK